MHASSPAIEPSRFDRLRVPAVIVAIVVLEACANRPATDDESVSHERFEAVRAEREGAQQEIAELRLELAQAEQRNEHLARNAERLQADIGDAEEALVALESGLKGMHSRADAVSALADARIVVTRAARQAPWRRDSIEQAREKLAEAERHIEEEYFGSAVFFTVRGRRIAEEALTLARDLREDPATRFIRVQRANLRSGSSTEAGVVTVLERGTPVHVREENGDWARIVTIDEQSGWIHGSLLATDP